MTTDRLRRRWRLILLLVLVFCVASAGGFYTYGVLSDNESVEVTIEGSPPTLSPGLPTTAALADGVRTAAPGEGVPTDAVRLPDEGLIDDELTRGPPDG